MSEEILLQEAAYETSPTLKKIEKLFDEMQQDVLKFYEGMKKRGMSPSKLVDVFNYYYSTLPDTDGTRFTQYNDKLKEIEDLVKKMFGFRSVRIDFRLITFYGPSTSMSDKAIFTVPFIHDGKKEIKDTMDVGTLQTMSDGKIRYRVGYKSEVKASKKGIEYVTDTINLSMNLEMNKQFTGRHYVAQMLHEIGHNFDMERLNFEIKNDAKMIKVVNLGGKKGEDMDPMPYMRFLFQLLKERNGKKKDHYTDAMVKQMKIIASKIGHGGEDKRHELLADQLPAAYGYGPALIQSLQIMAPDLREKDKIEHTKGLFGAYKNYKKALVIASRLNRREKNEHGSNVYRLKMILKQLKQDLNETKDSKLKTRLKDNIAELEKILNNIIHQKGNTEEMCALLKVWVENMDKDDTDEKLSDASSSSRSMYDEDDDEVEIEEESVETCYEEYDEVRLR